MAMKKQLLSFVLCLLLHNYSIVAGTVFPLSSLDASSGHLIFGESATDSAGESVHSAGDFNQDSLEDLLIGAPNADVLSAGAAYVVYGDVALAASQSLASFNGMKIPGLASGDQMGSKVIGGGDVNGDGIPDIAVSAPSVQVGIDLNVGVVYVIFGSILPFPAVFDVSTLDGSNGYAVVGRAAEHFTGSGGLWMADVNGDTIDDLIIASDQADPGGLLDAGQIDIVYGRNDGAEPATFLLSSINGVNGASYSGVLAGEDSGASVCCSDQNGDGIADLILGVPGAIPGGLSDAGEIHVLYGSGSLPAAMDKSFLDGVTGYILEGESANQRVGDGACAGGLDLSGDGLQDAVVGASFANLPGPILFAGISFMLLGNSSGSQPAIRPLSSAVSSGAVLELYGVAAIDRAGSGLNSDGDASGDSITDLLVGALGTDNVAAEAGSAYLIEGSISTLTNPLLLSDIAGGPLNGVRYDGELANGNAGTAVAMVDLNGDGTKDPVIAAPGVSTVYIVYGPPPPTATATPTTTATATVTTTPTITTTTTITTTVTPVMTTTATTISTPTPTPTTTVVQFQVIPENGRADTEFSFQFFNWPSSSLYNVKYVSEQGFEFLLTSQALPTAELQGLLPVGVIPVTGIVIASDGSSSLTDTISVLVNAVTDIDDIKDQLAAVNDSISKGNLQDALQALVSISTQIKEANLTDDGLQRRVLVLLQNLFEALESLDNNSVTKMLFILSTLTSTSLPDVDADAYDLLLQLLLDITAEVVEDETIGLSKDDGSLILSSLDPAVTDSSSDHTASILTNTKIATLQTLEDSCDTSIKFSSAHIEVEVSRESLLPASVNTSSALFDVPEEVISSSASTSQDGCSSKSVSQVNGSFTDDTPASAIHSLSYHNASNGFKEIAFTDLTEPLSIAIQTALILPSTQTLSSSSCGGSAKKKTTEPKCVFFDTAEQTWSEEGCKVAEQSEQQTVCECNHLTDFAVTIGANIEGGGGNCESTNEEAFGSIIQILSIALIAAFALLITLFIIIVQKNIAIREFVLGSETVRIDKLRKHQKNVKAKLRQK